MKNPAAIIGIAAWLSFMLAGCVGLPNTETGKEIFESKCATCHGLSGKGDGPQSLIIPKKPANLTILAKKNGGVFPTKLVYKIIDGRQEVAAHGPRTMPVWGMFFQVDVPEVPPEDTGTLNFREAAVHNKIKALIDYLITLQEQ